MEQNSISNSEMVLFPESILNENIKKRPKLCSIFWILSLISWILFIFFGLLDIIIFICKKNKDEFAIWSFIIINKSDKISEKYDIPIQMHNNFFILFLIIILIFATFQFIYFLINSIFKNINIYDSMMGPLSKFHFFPLLCYNTVFIIGFFLTFLKINIDKIINILVLDIIISIFGLLSLIFIYKQTKFKYEVFYKVLIIKKGTYSCLLALMIYHIGYNITVFECILDIFTKIECNGSLSSKKCNVNTMCVYLSIIIGLLNLILGLSLKDIILLIMNFLIYFDISIKTNINKIKIIDIIINILFFSSSIYLIIRAIKNRNLN